MSKEKNSSNRGAAMIMVLCIMSIFIMLSLGLLLGASTVIGSARKAAVSEQCRVAAVSFSKMITEELTDEGSQTMEDYLRQEISEGNWNPYDTTKSDSGPETSKNSNQSESFTRDFQISNQRNAIAEETGGYGITVSMYWKMPPENMGQVITKQSERDYDGATLVIIVICKKDNESYKIKTNYNLKCNELKGNQQKDTQAPDNPDNKDREVAWIWTLGAIE